MMIGALGLSQCFVFGDILHLVSDRQFQYTTDSIGKIFIGTPHSDCKLILSLLHLAPYLMRLSATVS